MSLFSLCLWTLKSWKARLVSPLTPSTRLACNKVLKEKTPEIWFCKSNISAWLKNSPTPQRFYFFWLVISLSSIMLILLFLIHEPQVVSVDLKLCQMETQLTFIPYLYPYTPPPNVQLPHWLHLWLQTMYMDLCLLFYLDVISWLPCFARRLIVFSLSLHLFTSYPFHSSTSAKIDQINILKFG